MTYPRAYTPKGKVVPLIFIYSIYEVNSISPILVESKYINTTNSLVATLPTNTKMYLLNVK